MPLSESEVEALRSLLSRYPRNTKEIVEEQIDNYEERADFKANLISGRGMPNMVAEVFLDKQGWPRPPGWHSVFFYPGGSLPRIKYILLCIVTIVITYILLR